MLVRAVELSKTTGRNLAEATVDNSSLILAESRTQRKDPLNNFELYTGGWNIRNKHYWAVSFVLTGFVLSFVRALLLLSIHCE